mgnify:FL=1
MARILGEVMMFQYPPGLTTQDQKIHQKQVRDLEIWLRAMGRAWSRGGHKPDSYDVNRILMSYAQIELLEFNIINAE